MSLGRKFREWATQPHAVSKVDGFTISVTKRKREGIENSLPLDKSHYEVVLQSTALNPEYPHDDIRAFYFSHAAEGAYAQDEPGRRCSNAAYLAHDRQFIAFELVEEKAPPVTLASGAETPGHHAIKLKMIYLGADGREKTAMFNVDGWVRRSDRHALEGGAEAASDRLIASATVAQDKVTIMRTLRLKRQGGYVAFA